MKVRIKTYGTLEIIAENETESFALQSWVNDSVKIVSKTDTLEVFMGSLTIERVDGKDCIDELDEN